MAQSNNSAPTCRVVAQYHNDGERVYEIETPHAAIEVRISSRAIGGGERSWHVAAQQRNASDATPITDEADTKRSALGKVAEKWGERAVELGLPALDWTAVEAALLTVRGV